MQTLIPISQKRRLRFCPWWLVQGLPELPWKGRDLVLPSCTGPYKAWSVDSTWPGKHGLKPSAPPKGTGGFGDPRERGRRWPYAGCWLGCSGLQGQWLRRVPGEGEVLRARDAKAAVLRAVSLINRLLQAAVSIPDSGMGQGYASVCCVSVNLFLLPA